MAAPLAHAVQWALITARRLRGAHERPEVEHGLIPVPPAVCGHQSVGQLLHALLTEPLPGQSGQHPTDVGIDDKWMKETAAAIQPGTAALFVLVRKVTADKVLEGLKGEGGTVLKTSLDHTKEAALQAALAGVQAAVPSPPS